MKAKHGWILFDTVEESFVDGNFRAEGVTLSKAGIYLTRGGAREDKLRRDRIRKVELDSKGNAIRVIPGR